MARLVKGRHTESAPAAVKLQAWFRGWSFRMAMAHEVLVSYTNYDPSLQERLVVFSESRKIRKLRYIQAIYRQYVLRKRKKMYATILVNTMYSYLYFFRRKVRWIRENIGNCIVVSSIHAEDVSKSLAFFKNAPFQSSVVPSVSQYGGRRSFYSAPQLQSMAAHRCRTPTVMIYASRFYRDKLYSIRFRQPVYGPRRVPRLAPSKPSAFTRAGDIFRSKLTYMICISCKTTGPDADSQLTKLFYILKRSVEIFTLRQVQYGAAAVSIQRRWRGSYCRMKMLPLMITNIVEKRATVLMQRWWRSLSGLKKRFRILSSVMSAARRIDSPAVYLDALTFFQLLQMKKLPAISHSVSSYPEFSGIPIVNLNGNVIFKKARRSVARDRTARQSIPSEKLLNGHKKKVKLDWSSQRGIPQWISLFKLAAEHRFNSMSYEGKHDSDGVAQIKDGVVLEEKHQHRSSLQASFSQTKIFFNLLSNGCSISSHDFPVHFERRASEVATKWSSMRMIKLVFPSVLEARCRCALLMLATMDTFKEESVVLLSQADMTNRLGKISTLSDTIPQAIFSQLTEPRRWARPGAFGKYSESSGVAHIAEIIDVRLDKPSNRNVYSLLGDAAVVLDMETQRPRYLYCDLFSMGVLVDDDSVGLANTAIVGRDLTPVPFLRPIRDPLDSILRVNGWPRHSSTPSWLRKEKRSGDDLIKFNFFMESLKMFSSNDINDNIPFVNSSQTRPGSASLRPSSMYKNKNSTDSTGMAYWEEWEREIPTASLNGIKPSTPTIAIVVGRGCSPGGRRPGSAEPVAGLNSEVIMGVFPTKPPPLAVKEEVCLDKVMFSRPRSPDPVMSTVAEVDSTKTATNWFEGDSRSTKGWVGSSTGVSSGESTLPPGSPRWLRRHLWSIPRVLMWCADSMSDLEQSGRLRTMTGYAALQREKRELKEGLSPDTETVEELDDIECTSRPATRAVSPRKAINRAVTASARLDIVHQVRSKLNSSGHVAQQTPRSPNKVATLQSPRPQSPFFTNQHQSYAILKQEMFLETIFDDASASTAPRPKTATAIMTKMDKESIHYVGIGEAPASPIIGSTENIRSGKEEFIRIRNAGAKELRQHLEASRQLTELELEALLREKQMKIQEAKDKSVEFDLRGKLNKKRDALTASNKAEKVVIEQQFELLSEAKLSEEEESRQRIRDHRQLLAARSKHRVGVIKNNVTLCALSKYSQVSQLREHKERERQKFQDVKKRNFRNIRAASNSDSNANDAAAAIFQAAGFHFDESSITDSLDSNELLPGIVNLSEFSFVEKGRRNSAASKAVTGVMIQQSVLSKTVESLDSMLSRSNQKNALNNSKQPHL